MLDSCTFFIYGSTGNLSRNKLLPALYYLEEAGRLPQEMAIVGFGRRDWDNERWRDEVSQEPGGSRGVHSTMTAPAGEPGLCGVEHCRAGTVPGHRQDQG